MNFYSGYTKKISGLDSLLESPCCHILDVSTPLYKAAFCQHFPSVLPEQVGNYVITTPDFDTVYHHPDIATLEIAFDFAMATFKAVSFREPIYD